MTDVTNHRCSSCRPQDPIKNKTENYFITTDMCNEGCTRRTWTINMGNKYSQ